MEFIKDEKNPNVFTIKFTTEEEKKRHEEYLALFCSCEDKDEDDMPTYVEGHMGVDHGWICNECEKFVQIG